MYFTKLQVVCVRVVIFGIKTEPGHHEPLRPWSPWEQVPKEGTLLGPRRLAYSARSASTRTKCLQFPFSLPPRELSGANAPLHRSTLFFTPRSTRQSVEVSSLRDGYRALLTLVFSLSLRISLYTASRGVMPPIFGSAALHQGHCTTSHRLRYGACGRCSAKGG